MRLKAPYKSGNLLLLGRTLPVINWIINVPDEMVASAVSLGYKPLGSSPPLLVSHEPKPISGRKKIVHLQLRMSVGGAERVCQQIVNYSPPDWEHEIITVYKGNMQGREFRVKCPVTRLNQVGEVGQVDLQVVVNAIEKAEASIICYAIFGSWLTDPLFAMLNQGYQYVRVWHALNEFIGHYTVGPNQNFVATNKSLVSKVSSALPDATRLINNGVDLELYQPSDSGPPQVDTIGTVARIHDTKRLDLFGVVCRKVASITRRPLRALLIGECTYGHEWVLSDLGIQLAGHPNIALEAVHDQEGLAPWYRKMSVHVMTSELEGMPLAILEASSCGVPCISSNIGGISDFLPNDMLYGFGDTDTCAKLVSNLLNDKVAWTAASKQARKLAEGRDINVIISQYYELFEKAYQNACRNRT